MAKMPEFLPIKNFDEMIEVFGDQKKFLSRMADMKKVQDTINDKLDRMEKISNIEATKSQTDAKLSEANEVKRQADEYRHGQEKAVQELLTKAEGEATKMRADLAAKERTLQSKEQYLTTQMDVTEKAEAEARRKSTEAESALSAAVSRESAAKQLEAKLREKLGVLAAAAQAAGG